jgi:hypothetical protein
MSNAIPVPTCNSCSRVKHATGDTSAVSNDVRYGVHARHFTAPACACPLQEKHQKQVAASYAWSTKTKHKALTALLAYAQFRHTRAQQTIAARHHWALTRKAGVLRAWRGVARYLAPVRRALETMTSRVGLLRLM